MIPQSPTQLRRRLRTAVGASAVALAAVWLGSSGSRAADPDKAVDKIKTASPIKHVLIIVGENRSFDHVFATFKPKPAGESVSNLLSRKIINADGSPGPQFSLAHQFKIVSPPNGGKFFISADLKDKMLYAFLPPPDVAGTPAVSALSFILSPPFFPPGDPGLPPQSQFLFGTGGTGLSFTLGPDTRITNVNTLPPGPFQMTGPTMPYDAFTGDTIHQFFQMYQQMDCAIDKEHVSRGNPTGCLHDLQSAITTTFATGPGQTPHDTGQTMAFFNVQQGDAPILKKLADQYTMSDNYHQPVMGGTGPDSVPLGFADQVFFGDGSGNPLKPAANRIYNPDPQAGSLNLYTSRAQWFNCSDTSQPGIQAITSYLNALPYEISTNCDPGHFYPAVNINPAFNPDGTPSNPANNIPPVTMRSIGDALSEKNIPWKYYGGGYNASVAGNPINGYCNICNPFEYQANYPAMRADHMRDVTDLFSDLKNGTLPAVSYVKPDGAMDGHPNSSKLDLFEAFVDNIVQLAQSNKEQWAETAIFVTFDEGGGYYDSGFIQPVDFFGTGPRIPMIAVSPFSTGGHITHSYAEHSSVVKFVERNWHLAPLSQRSRDTLPNPRADDDNPYVPMNMPAIGDLFDMFNFHHDHDADQHG
ncbi:MAG TPA: alkaline phosphatase family protein [Xanthobacteraceae bacterium]|jgi:phospholipase C